MKKNYLPLTLLLIWFNSFSPLSAAEFLVFQGERTFSEADKGFHYYYRNNQEFPSTWPENWREPDDYWEGNLYIRIELKTTPENLPITLQACIWMHDADGTSTTTDELESCSQQRTAMSNPGVYEIRSTRISEWWHKNQGANAIDLARPRDFKRMGLVLRTDTGCYITPYNVTPNCWDDREQYLPMEFRLTIVAVSAGSTFSGWENYTKTKNPFIYSEQLGWLFMKFAPWAWSDSLQMWIYFYPSADPDAPGPWLYFHS